MDPVSELNSIVARSLNYKATTATNGDLTDMKESVVSLEIYLDVLNLIARTGDDVVCDFFIRHFTDLQIIERNLDMLVRVVRTYLEMTRREDYWSEREISQEELEDQANGIWNFAYEACKS